MNQLYFKVRNNAFRSLTNSKQYADEWSRTAHNKRPIKLRCLYILERSAAVLWIIELALPFELVGRKRSVYLFPAILSSQVTVITAANSIPTSFINLRIVPAARDLSGWFDFSSAKLFSN